MANPSKAKGTQAESAVVDLAHRFGIPAVRPALQGAEDKGDVWLWPSGNGARVVIEVKNRPTDFTHFPALGKLQEWWAETERETLATPNSNIGILAVKPKGIGMSRANDWWAWFLINDLDFWHGKKRTFDAHITPVMWPLGTLLADLLESGP